MFLHCQLGVFFVFVLVFVAMDQEAVVGWYRIGLCARVLSDDPSTTGRGSIL